MGYSKERRRSIYDRTSGNCHICRKKLAYTNYAEVGARGAWEVDHSVPRAAGGTDRLSNLYPACISCNRAKRDGSTRAARARNGRMRAPLSSKKRTETQAWNTVLGGSVGVVIGGWLLGRAGVFIGGAIGAAIGNAAKPG